MSAKRKVRGLFGFPSGHRPLLAVCSRGHAMTPENTRTYVVKGGKSAGRTQRFCRACSPRRGTHGQTPAEAGIALRERRWAALSAELEGVP